MNYITIKEAAINWNISERRIRKLIQDGNGITCRLLINYELIKNNFPPAVIEAKNRSKYYELLQAKNVKELSKWLEELSNHELERMKVIGYKDK